MVEVFWQCLEIYLFCLGQFPTFNTKAICNINGQKISEMYSNRDDSDTLTKVDAWMR